MAHHYKGIFICLLLPIFVKAQGTEEAELRQLRDQVFEMHRARIAQLTRRLGNTNDTAQHRKIYLNLSRRYGIVDRRAGIEMIRKAVALTAPTDTLTQMQVLGRLATIYRRMGQMDSCQYYIGLVEKHSNSAITYSEYMITKSTLAKYKGDFPTALDWLQKAVDIQTAAGHFPQTVYGTIGELYMDRREYRKALSYYEKILEQIVANEAEVKEDEMINMATCYHHVGQVQRSRYVLQLHQSHNLKRAKERGIYAGFANYLAAKVVSSQLDSAYQECLELANLAMEIFAKSGTPRQLIRLLYIRSGCLANQGQYQEALQDLNKAMNIVQSIKNRSLQIDILLARSKVYTYLGMPAKGLTDINAYQTLYSQIHEGRAAEEISFMERRIDRQEAAHQMDLLKRDIQLQTLTSEKRKKTMGLLLLLLSAVASITILLYRQLRYRKLGQAKILKSKHEAEQSLKEKEVLLREIHHRVKNNLQFISSLLSLQSEHIEDDHALSALQEGQDRVQSMALIHQNLYQEDNLMGVDVCIYFARLVQHLFDSYNISDSRISLDMDIESLHIDVDTIVPLGLIVNELVSNALKYAFPDEKPGTIGVSLRNNAGALCLIVSDDGVGINKSKVSSLGSSFGYRLIHAFCDQVNGEIKMQTDHGTTVILQIEDYPFDTAS